MSGQQDWRALQALTEPTRRAVFEAVRRAAGPQTREQVAAAVGIDRRLAAFHLDHLAAAGLLHTDFARPPGRSGPGAGRPAKRYAVPAGDLAVSVPPRRYDLVAAVLAQGVAAGAGATEAAGAAAAEEGRRQGVAHRVRARSSAATTLAAAAQALAGLGYEPVEADGCLRLRNCPFHAAVEAAPEVVCGVNERLVSGVLAGVAGHPSVAAVLEPSPPDCCVRVVVRR